MRLWCPWDRLAGKALLCHPLALPWHATVVMFTWSLLGLWELHPLLCINRQEFPEEKNVSESVEWKGCYSALRGSGYSFEFVAMHKASAKSLFSYVSSPCIRCSRSMCISISLLRLNSYHLWVLCYRLWRVESQTFWEVPNTRRWDGYLLLWSPVIFRKCHSTFTEALKVWGSVLGGDLCHMHLIH